MNLIIKALVASSLVASLNASTWEIDKIVARLNGVNLLLSTVNQPRITKEGGKFTLDEAILEELTYQKAAEMHMLPTTADVERHLTTFKIQNNLTGLSESEFENELKGHGFTLRSYKHQLGRMIAVENVRRAEMSEKLVVTTQEVEEHYKKHPKHTKEEFQLKMCIIPEDQLEDRDAFLKSKEATWEDLGWIAKKDLGKKFESATTMQKGALSDAIEIGNQHQVIMLVDKRERRLKTLDERYIDIERSLQQKKKNVFIKNFEVDLKKKASITYL